MAATRPGHKNWKPNTETEKTETEQIRLFFGYQSAETELISVFGFLFRFKPKTGILLDCTVLAPHSLNLVARFLLGAGLLYCVFVLDCSIVLSNICIVLMCCVLL